jgi:hypothetical protein
MSDAEDAPPLSFTLSVAVVFGLVVWTVGGMLAPPVQATQTTSAEAPLVPEVDVYPHDGAVTLVISNASSAVPVAVLVGTEAHTFPEPTTATLTTNGMPVTVLVAGTDPHIIEQLPASNRTGEVARPSGTLSTADSALPQPHPYP